MKYETSAVDKQIPRELKFKVPRIGRGRRTHHNGPKGVAPVAALGALRRRIGRQAKPLAFAVRYLLFAKSLI